MRRLDLSRFTAPGPDQGRRRVLRGLLGGVAVTVGLPWLEVFAGREAQACGGVIPKRFGVFMWGNGNRPERWTPVGEGTGSAWELSEELASLAPFKPKLSVITGTSVHFANTIPHWSGAAGFLTGHPAGGTDEDWWVTAPTFDQVLAADLGGATIFRSLELGIETTEAFSWYGQSSRAPAENNPFTVYERVFGPTFRLPGEGGAVDPSLGYRRSALDAVMEDLAALQGVVGAADRARLEQHLDGVRDLETRLARLQEDPPELDACAYPAKPLAEYPDLDGRPQLAEKNAAMAQILAMALACDQTRVFSYQFSKPLTNALFPGADDGHHNLTHDEQGDQPIVHAITTFVVEQLAVLLAALDAVPEEDGTLLDNCCVLATSDVSEGQLHSLDEMPIVLAGGCCGALKTDVHYRSISREPSTKVLLSVARAMDLLLPSFGLDEMAADTGISAIEA